LPNRLLPFRMFSGDPQDLVSMQLRQSRQLSDFTRSEDNACSGSELEDHDL
jgi:hypothetical protein